MVLIPLTRREGHLYLPKTNEFVTPINSFIPLIFRANPFHFGTFHEVFLENLEKCIKSGAKSRAESENINAYEIGFGISLDTRDVELCLAYPVVPFQISEEDYQTALPFINQILSSSKKELERMAVNS